MESMARHKAAAICGIDRALPSIFLSNGGDGVRGSSRAAIWMAISEIDGYITEWTLVIGLWQWAWESVVDTVSEYSRLTVDG